jgi:starch phosphorylase
MDAPDLNFQAELLSQKVKHYLITTMGVTTDEASYLQFYHALALTLREEIMINWTATSHTFRENHVRQLYYLCMEYMPGRLFLNNVINMNALPLVKLMMQKLNRNFDHVLRDEMEPGLGNGGMGRLLSCFLDSLATQHYPAKAYGLRYQYGIFEQEIWDGHQIERPDPWLLYENPWEFRRDNHAFSVCYAGHILPYINENGVEIGRLADYEEVRALAFDIPIIGYCETPEFSVTTLRLWSTKDSPRNFELQRYNAGQIGQAAENSSLTDVLYPNDNNETGKRIRLKQEFILASASIQDILHDYLRFYGDMSLFADKVRIQINETHPALAIIELTRLLLQDHNYGWGEAWDIVRTCCSFTNHSILREALEEWNIARMNSLLPIHTRIIEKMNLEFCTAVRRKFPDDEERVRRISIIEGGEIRMAHLAIYGTHKTNGVAELHSDILRHQLFKDFYAMYPDRFVNITNGITQRYWLLMSNPLLAELITQRIGRRWITDFTAINELAQYASDPQLQAQFLEIKQKNKLQLIQFLQGKNPIRDAYGKIIGHSGSLKEDALFECHIKRIHEYKRQLMNALHILMLYADLKQDINARPAKRMVIFAGKAAPGYEIAKNIIHLIFCIARKINMDSSVNQKLRVAFIEGYNVKKATMIIPAADLSVQASTAGMEASGTGNMKLAINGALTIGTEDGANVEMRKAITEAWWPFGFGASAQENDATIIAGNYNPEALCQQNGKIGAVVKMLQDGSLVQSDLEHELLTSLASTLLKGGTGDPPDRYLVLRDLESFYQVQKKVEALFCEPLKWAETALHNIAGMSAFSADSAIHNYARDVWELRPCPPDTRELARVRGEYSQHDKCRIR